MNYCATSRADGGQRCGLSINIEGGVVVVVSEEEALRGDDNEQQEWEHNDVKKY